MKRSKVVKAIATAKYMMMGKISVLSGPKMASITILTIVINNPQMAVPTVYFETTPCER